MCAGSKPGHASANGSPYMSPTDVSTPGAVARARAPTARGPTGPRIGSATLLRVLHHRDEACRTDRCGDRRSRWPRPRRGRRPRTRRPRRPRRPRRCASSVAAVGERVEVAQVVACPSARRSRATTTMPSCSTGVMRVEALGAVVMRGRSPSGTGCAASSGAAGAADLQLQVAEAVERIGPAAGRDAAAVLRPGRGVLDVPELAVGRRHARHRAELCNAAPPRVSAATTEPLPRVACA